MLENNQRLQNPAPLHGEHLMVCLNGNGSKPGGCIQWLPSDNSFLVLTG